MKSKMFLNVKNICSQSCALIGSFFCEKKLFKKFFCVFCVYLVSFFSLLKADYLYFDGVKGLHTVPNYASASLPLSKFFAKLLFFENRVHDIAPVSYLLAIVFLSIASLMLVKIICKEITYKRLIMSCMLGLSPYFLQSMSYKFDCMFIALSFIFAIYPFLFFSCKKLFYIHSVCGLALLMVTYQPSVSIWLMLLIYLTFKEWMTSHEMQKVLFRSFLISLLLFIGVCVISSTLMGCFNDKAGEVSHPQFCFLPDCLEVLLSNLIVLKSYVFHHWNNAYSGWLFVLILLLFVVHILSVAISSKNNLKKIDNTLLGLLLVPLIVLFVTGWALFFLRFAIEPRILVGFSGLLSLMLLDCSLISNHKIKFLISLFGCVFVLHFFIFAARYGNLLIAQKQYEAYHFSKLAQKMDDLNVHDILFRPGILQSPIVKAELDKYPLYGDMLSLRLEQQSLPYDYLNFQYGVNARPCTNKRRTAVRSIFASKHLNLIRINDRCVQVQFFNK